MDTVDRRDFFKIGALAALGLSFDGLIQPKEAETAARALKEKLCKKLKFV